MGAIQAPDGRDNSYSFSHCMQGFEVSVSLCWCAGHGAGKPTDKIIAEAADSYAFLAKAMNASWQHQKQ